MVEFAPIQGERKLSLLLLSLCLCLVQVPLGRLDGVLGDRAAILYFFCTLVINYILGLLVKIYILILKFLAASQDLTNSLHF